MRSVFRNICNMVLVFAAMLILFGCAQHLPTAAEPVSRPNPAPTAAAPALEPNKIIVAKVNNAEITMDALVKIMNSLPEKSDGSPETLEERKKRALESVVLLELAYQRATAQGLNADPNRIEIAMINFRDNIGGEKEYAEYLTRHGITETELRSQIERDLTINIIYTKDVVDMVSIPEAELKNEYEKEKQQYLQPEKVSVIDVFLLKDEGKASSKKATGLLNMIKADANQDPWKLILDGTFMVRKLVVRQDKEKELYDAAKKLKPRALSGVIRTPTGIHIIKMESYSPERLLTFEEAKPQIVAKLKGPYQEKKTLEWERELKKDAKIELLDTTGQQEQKKP
jgi:parvulin-like peptidyl-prolyl isomerase